jgi:hypothetical protein
MAIPFQLRALTLRQGGELQRELSLRLIAREIEYIAAAATDLGAFADRGFLHDTKIGRQPFDDERLPVIDEHYPQALALRAPQMNSILTHRARVWYLARRMPITSVG